MRKELKGLAIILSAAAVLTTSPVSASTLTFDFSITNISGDVSGTLTGEIDGLSDNTANQAATAVYLTNDPSNIVSSGAVFPNTITAAAFPVLLDNSFTVVAGEITAVSYEAVTAADFAGLVLNSSGTYYLNNPFTGKIISSDIISFTNVSATPLPAALPLFATGLGAIGLLGWRRKRKNAAAIAAA